MKPLKCDQCGSPIIESSQGLLQWIPPDPPGGGNRIAPRAKLEPMELRIVHGETCSSREAEKIYLADALDHDGILTRVGLEFIADAGLRSGGVMGDRGRPTKAQDALKMILRLIRRSEA
jgi:hypothetical protein